MYALWCLFFLVILSGGLGGFVYSLNSSYTHSIKFRGKEYDSGVWGHLVMGIGGAFVALAASVPVLDLDLEVFGSYWSEDSLTPDIVPIVIFISAIGILGGYSGLKIISGLSDAMLRKIQQDVRELQGDTSRYRNELYEAEDEIRKLRDALDDNTAKDRERELELEKTKASNELLNGLFSVQSNNPREGVERIEEYLKRNPENAKAWLWLGMGYKRLRDLKRASGAAIRATELNPDDWVAWYNIACYSSLLQEDLEEGVICNLRRAKEKIHNKQELEDLLDGLKTDGDFLKVRDEDRFQEFVNEVTSAIDEVDNCQL